MVRKAAVLQRKSDDVGWFLRGIRSVDRSERVSTAPGYDRSRRRRASRGGFPVPVQHFWHLRDAMAHLHERSHGQQQPFWKQQFLGEQRARNVHGALGKKLLLKKVAVARDSARE